MWSFLYRRKALGCLPDVYRMAYFLSGSRLQAAELVQKAYQQVWSRRERGERIENWRLVLLHTLVQDSGAVASSHADPPPLWDALSKLERGARAVLVLDSLDLTVKQIARVVEMPERTVLQRLKAAREAFGMP